MSTGLLTIVYTTVEMNRLVDDFLQTDFTEMFSSVRLVNNTPTHSWKPQIPVVTTPASRRHQKIVVTSFRDSVAGLPFITPDPPNRSTVSRDGRRLGSQQTSFEKKKAFCNMLRNRFEASFC